MSLEERIAALTAAVEANTAALKGAGKSTASSGSTSEKKGGKHTKDEMKAALKEVKEKFGTQDAKTIVANVGKADKMDDINDAALIDAVFDAAKAKLAEKKDDDI